MNESQIAAAFDKFRESTAAGAGVAAVDADDVRLFWNSYQRMLKVHPELRERRAERAIGMGVFGDDNPFLKLGANAPATWFRCGVLTSLVDEGFLNEWLIDGELDEAVYRVAASFPMVPSPVGESVMTFDPAAFIARIRQEKTTH